MTHRLSRQCLGHAKSGHRCRCRISPKGKNRAYCRHHSQRRRAVSGGGVFQDGYHRARQFSAHLWKNHRKKVIVAMIAAALGVTVLVLERANPDIYRKNKEALWTWLSYAKAPVTVPTPVEDAPRNRPQTLKEQAIKASQHAKGAVNVADTWSEKKTNADTAVVDAKQVLDQANENAQHEDPVTVKMRRDKFNAHHKKIGTIRNMSSAILPNPEQKAAQNAYQAAQKHATNMSNENNTKQARAKAGKEKATKAWKKVPPKDKYAGVVRPGARRQ